MGEIPLDKCSLESWAVGKIQSLAGEREFDLQSLSDQVATAQESRATIVVCKVDLAACELIFPGDLIFSRCRPIT